MSFDLEAIVAKEIGACWEIDLRAARAVAEAVLDALDAEKEMVEFNTDEGDYLGYAIPLHCLGWLRLELKRDLCGAQEKQP